MPSSVRLIPARSVCAPLYRYEVGWSQLTSLSFPIWALTRVISLVRNEGAFIFRFHYEILSSILFIIVAFCIGNSAHQSRLALNLVYQTIHSSFICIGYVHTQRVPPHFYAFQFVHVADFSAQNSCSARTRPSRNAFARDKIHSHSDPFKTLSIYWQFPTSTSPHTIQRFMGFSLPSNSQASYNIFHSFWLHPSYYLYIYFSASATITPTSWTHIHKPPLPSLP